MKNLKYLLLSACVLSMTAAFAFTACSDNKEPVDTTDPEEPSTFVEDTNTYYAIGTGAGDLYASSWNMNYTGLSFVKDTSVTDANVYTLTMKMYAGDHFQIIHDASWDGQMGARFLSGAIGYGSYAYATFDSENKMELFGGGDYGSDIEAAQGGVYTFTLTTFPESPDLNTITYTRVVNYDMTIRGDVSETGMTDIGGNWEYVLVVDKDDLKRDAQGAAVANGAEYAAVQVYNAAKSHGYYLAEGDYAAYNDSVYGYVNLLPEGAYYIAFSESSDKIAITPTSHDIEIQGIKTPVKMTIGDGVWTATVTVAANDYAEGKDYAEISLCDRVSDGSLATLQLSAGTYAIKYSESGVAYEELAYYLVGTFANAGWDISENSVELQATDRNGVYSAAFMLADMTANNQWLTEEGGTDAEGRTAIFAFRTVYGSKLNGIAEWCDASNTFVYEAGEATVTFVKGYGIYVSIDTSKDGTEYTEDTNKYGLAGTINGWTTEFADELAFEKDATVTDKNVYKLTVTLAADAEIKAVIYGSWDNAMGADKVTGIGTDLVDSDGNIKVVTAGEYTFTLTTYPNNPAQNTITYTCEEKTTDENVEDTNKYGLAGTINGWTTEFADELAFEKDATVTDKNVYKLTVTLAADAEIKAVIYGSWDNAMGADKVTGIGTDLVDSDGNIKVVTAGEYTFTLTTYPNNPAQNTITYTCEEKTTDENTEDTNKYGLAGTINGWTTEFADELAFEKDATVTDKNVYKLTVTLAADAEIKAVIYGSWDNAMGADKVTGIGTDLVDSDGNIKVVTAGEYTFTLTTYPEDTSKNAITYTVVPSTGGSEDDGETGVNAYHLVGSGSLFGDGQSWNTGYAEYAFTKTGDNVYTITVTLAADDEFKVIKGDGWDNQIDSSAVQGLGADLADNGGNIKVVTAGEYTLTITVGENGAVSLTYTLA